MNSFNPSTKFPDTQDFKYYVWHLISHLRHLSGSGHTCSILASAFLFVKAEMLFKRPLRFQWLVIPSHVF